ASVEAARDGAPAEVRLENVSDKHPVVSVSVVMPAYNEENVIRDVVEAWDRQLAALDLSHELRVYDDGSRDQTGALLEAGGGGRPALAAVPQPDPGHGR